MPAGAVADGVVGLLDDELVVVEWMADGLARSPRFKCACIFPTWRVKDAIREINYIKSTLGAIMMPAVAAPEWNHRQWEPMWWRSKRPSCPWHAYYLRRQVHATFQDDPVGIHNIAFTGAESLIRGSDYPHHDGTYPHSRETVDRLTAGLDEASIAACFARTPHNCSTSTTSC